MNITKAVDEHVETELAEARETAARLMEETVAAYRLVTELEMARDLRRTLGATLRPFATDLIPFRKESA